MVSQKTHTTSIPEAIEHTLTAAKQALDGLSLISTAGLTKAVETIVAAEGRLVITGIGKSGLIGAKLVATFSSLGIPAVYLHPADALHGDLGMMKKGDVLLALSKSGESKELIKIVAHAKEQTLTVIGITTDSTSRLAAAADIALVFSLQQEGSPHEVAPMASATCMLVIGHMLATGVCTKKGFTEKEFAALHPGGSLGLKLQTVAHIMRGKDLCPLVSNTASLQEVLKEMTDKKNIGVAGVVNNKQSLIGVISDGDIRRYFLREPLASRPTAEDMMSQHPKTIARTATLYEAIQKMEAHKITALFVLDEKNIPCGIIHMHDIVGAELV